MFIFLLFSIILYTEKHRPDENELNLGNLMTRLEITMMQKSRLKLLKGIKM